MGHWYSSGISTCGVSSNAGYSRRRLPSDSAQDWWPSRFTWGMMRIDPSDYNALNNIHEVTQHEAAVAWAHIAVRTGLIRQFMHQPRNAQGVPQKSRIEKMLTNTNPIFNLAAVEALHLLFKRDPPAKKRRRRRARRPPAQSSGTNQAPEARIEGRRPWAATGPLWRSHRIGRTESFSPRESAKPRGPVA